MNIHFYMCTHVDHSSINESINKYISQVKRTSSVEYRNRYYN